MGSSPRATRATRWTCWPSTSWRWSRSTPWTVADLAAVVRRAAPFAALPDTALHAVLDMLAGRYPSEEFGELRARITWDRVTDELRGRPGAQRLAVTSGGTIPDRGLFTVTTPGGADGRGSRVGELDEEMVYESRVGDTFLLGTSSWRVEDITHDRVIVTPAPGRAGPDAVLEGRVDRAAAGAGPGGRGVRPGDGRACPTTTPAPGRRPRGSTSGRPTTCSRTCASSARPPGTCPVIGRSSSSGSATSWATGGWWCTPPSAPRSTARGRWRSPPGCGSGGVWRCTPRARTTGSCCGSRTPSTTRAPRWCPRPRTCCSIRPRSSRSSSRSWAGRRCTRRGSGSARPAPCCSPGATRSGVPRCGSSGSGRRSCWPSPGSTSSSR